jgi:hypothetical protein
MDELASLRNGGAWRLAVWGLRVMGTGLGVVVAGLIALLWSVTAGRAMVAAGIGIYLVGVVITLVGILWIYRRVKPARPSFLDMRWALLHDAVRPRPASAEQPMSAGQPINGSARAEPHTQPPDGEDAASLRYSDHWRMAVLGVRLMGPGLVLVAGGLVSLLWSTATGKAVLAAGIGLYLIGMVIMLVGLIRVSGEVQPPRPDRARTQKTLLHDALHARP